MSFWYSAAMIFNGYSYVVAGRYRQGVFGPHLRVFHPHINDTSLRHRLMGIYDQIADDLADLSLIRVNGPHVIRNREFATTLEPQRNSRESLTMRDV
jgi:hypothetical protein